MWNGKLKAITFSFDDGVTQDKRAIKILDKYGLKATFNINSALLGLSNTLERNNVTVSHNKLNVNEIKEVYKNHEIASHTLTHPTLTKLSDDEILYQVNSDVKSLEDLIGKSVKGFAYPGGGINFDSRVSNLIKNNTNIKYCRSTISSYNFDLQDNLYEFKPTVYYIEGCLFDICQKFLDLETVKPQLLYIWGHTYEMDANYISWEKFEELCKMLSNKDNIFYGTNSEVLL